MGPYKNIKNIEEMKYVNFDSIIIRYSGEIGIKGAWTRRVFERQLLNNIINLLNHHKIRYNNVIRKYGRLYLKTSLASKASFTLANVFGISSLSPAVETTSKLDDVVAKCLFLAGSVLNRKNSFSVRCRRVGDHSYTSVDVCREVGRQILTEFHELDLRVDLDHPDVELMTEIRDDRAFIFTEYIKGVGGLPLGTQPVAVCLLSGGIDSAVACWYGMKRGCPTVPIYFDNTPYTDESTTHRALDIAKVLYNWAIGFPRRFYIVPHGQNLIEFKENCPERLTCILCKRMMYRVAERIADIEGAEGIITGDILGEQASQTLRNLRVLTMAAIKYPIHRPLFGFDKTETEQIARKIGTYKLSSKRAKGCTAVPRKPATAVDPQKVEEAEKTLNIGKLVERSVNSIKIIAL